jgi:putative transcriptional regulator
MATVKATPEMIEKALRDTDWAKLDAMTDEDIARQVAENPDAAPILSDAENLAARVRFLRRREGLSQAAFGARYGIPVATVRDWEQGRRAPDRAVLSYLAVIERDPAAVARALAGRPRRERRPGGTIRHADGDPAEGGAASPKSPRPQSAGSGRHLRKSHAG